MTTEVHGRFRESGVGKYPERSPCRRCSGRVRQKPAGREGIEAKEVGNAPNPESGAGGRRPTSGFSITPVSSPEDFGAAKMLLSRYRRWLEGILGGDLAVAQPSAERELSDLEHFYEPPNGRLLLAVSDSGPVGVVGVHCLDGSGVGEMKRLYVAPEARGLGAGRALVSAAIAAAEDLGFCALRLETHAGYMPEAVALYREAGFRETNPYHSVVGVEGVMTMEMRLHRMSA